MPKQPKFGADETGKTFGPAETGWYFVSWKPEPTEELRRDCRIAPGGDFFGHIKARSAFEASAHFGKNLSTCHVAFITNPTIIDRLEGK